MNVLLTGFEPFGNFTVNPTKLLAKHFDGHQINNTNVVGKVVMLEFPSIGKQIEEAIESYRPKAIVMTGQVNRNAITPERIAINYANAKTPYNCETFVENQILDMDGPDGIFYTLQ